MHACIYLTSQPYAGFDLKLIFKQSTFGLNSKLSFSQNGCLTKAKESSMSSFLPCIIDGFISSLSVLVRSEIQFCSGFELWLPIPFPKSITKALSVLYTQLNIHLLLWNAHIYKYTNICLYFIYIYIYIYI